MFNSNDENVKIFKEYFDASMKANDNDENIAFEHALTKILERENENGYEAGYEAGCEETLND